MPYKTCTLCNFIWQDMDEMVEDQSLRIIGYQANYVDPNEGYLLLNHDTADCHTTIAVIAEDFKPLYKGPVYTKHNTGCATCLHKCQDEQNFETCTEECDMAWVREIIQIFRKHRLPE